MKFAQARHPGAAGGAVAKLHEGMLDRDRPLWQFTVIEGLQDGQRGFYSSASITPHWTARVASRSRRPFSIPAATPRAWSPRKRKRAAPAAITARMLSAAFRNTVRAIHAKIVKAVPDAFKVAGRRRDGAIGFAGEESRRTIGAGHRHSGISADFKPGDSLQKIAQVAAQKDSRRHRTGATHLAQCRDQRQACVCRRRASPC